MTNKIKGKNNNYRTLFDLDNDYIYFNSAGSSPTPIASRAATYANLDFKNYTIHKDTELFQWFDKIRGLAGSLINAKASEIALTSNTTMGLNIIAQGVDLKASDSVLVHGTEFPANLVPWLHLRKKGVDVRVIESDGFPTPEDFFKRVDKTTKIIAVSLVRFFDGFRFNLDEIGKFCKKNGIFLVVDGIQGVGAVPIDVKKLGIDALSCAGAKWLCSPCGTGFLYISEEIQDKVQAPFAGWLSWMTERKFENCIQTMKEPNDISRFEFGTIPYPSFAAFEKTLELLNNIGVENIFNHITKLLDYLIDFISQSKDYKFISSLNPQNRSCFLSFKSMHDTKMLYDHLVNNKVITSHREGGIRVSPHLYNTMDEMKRFCEIVDAYNG
jgi:cysteine desulfurase / selenocysteine lyase